METLDHRALKALARGFARGLGCCAVASEVTAPVPRYRVDVAGYGDRLPGPRGANHGVGGMGERTRAPVRDVRERPRAFTVIIECKQSRADFLRDTREREALLCRRRALHRQLAEIENTLLPACEPHLRIPRDAALGPALFPQLDAWDHARSTLPAYRETLREIARVDKALHGDTKFCCLAAWRLADLLYIAAPRGMIGADEIPGGWGLVEFTRPSRAGSRRQPPWSGPVSPLPSVGEEVASPRRDRRGGAEQADALLSTVRVSCDPLNSPDHRRVRLLRNIAVKSTRTRPIVHTPTVLTPQST